MLIHILKNNREEIFIMKTYVKPTVDVVELSVKENMAALPTGVSGTTSTLNYATYGDVATTVYDLTKASASAQL